jgi:PAS domain S-box-containing protein
MLRLFNKLRIGEKIGLGFGFVCILFLGVIWQHQMTLKRSLSEYQGLLDVFEAKKSFALNIGRFMLAARSAEKNFLIHRKPLYAARVGQYVGQVQEEANKLKKIDVEGFEVGKHISRLIKNYHNRFEAMVAAWQKKGLDHNSGLQGRFRDRVHEMENLAGNFKAGSLYLQLLQIRRGEKDLGLRREKQYYDSVFQLIDEFIEKVNESELEVDLKLLLRKEIDVYRQAFIDFAQDILTHNNIKEGKGPFRDSAHRIEDVLKAHYVPDLEEDILQLRRREKDYLLRLDKQYVHMAQQEIQHIRAHIAQSSISPEDKQKFNALLEDYETDFLALVAQNDLIDRLAAEMQEASRQITQLVELNVEMADRQMKATADTIYADSQANTHMMLAIVLVALILGIFFAIFITRRITDSLHRIGAALGRLAHSDPTDRLPVTGGRDELDAMASAVNTTSDHMERLVAWSMASTLEDEAHLRKALLSIPPGIFLANKDGVIESLNPKLANLFGYTPAALIGQPINNLFPVGQGPAQSLFMLHQVGPRDTQGVIVDRETRGLTQDGREIPLRLVISPLGRGEEWLYAGLVVDITAHRQAKAEFHKTMEDKQELLGTMRREINVLMDNIIGTVDDLAETGRAGRRRTYADIIRRSGQWVLDIIDVILGYSEIQIRWLELNERNFDLHLLLDNLSIFFSNFARIKGIAYRMQCSPDLPAVVYGDSIAIGQILANLLSNAVKFTETGEVKIYAELKGEDESGYRIGFKVQDTGRGMDPEKLKHFFEPLDQVPVSETFEYRRPSQGLVITKQLVELLGGEIDVSSQFGAGSVFSVKLLLKRASGKA